MWALWTPTGRTDTVLLQTDRMSHALPGLRVCLEQLLPVPPSWADPTHPSNITSDGPSSRKPSLTQGWVRHLLWAPQPSPTQFSGLSALPLP